MWMCPNQTSGGPSSSCGKSELERAGIPSIMYNIFISSCSIPYKYMLHKGVRARNRFLERAWCGAYFLPAHTAQTIVPCLTCTALLEWLHFYRPLFLIYKSAVAQEKKKHSLAPVFKCTLLYYKAFFYTLITLTKTGFVTSDSKWCEWAHFFSWLECTAVKDSKQLRETTFLKPFVGSLTLDRDCSSSIQPTRPAWDVNNIGCVQPITTFALAGSKRGMLIRSGLFPQEQKLTSYFTTVWILTARTGSSGHLKYHVMHPFVTR